MPYAQLRKSATIVIAGVAVLLAIPRRASADLTNHREMNTIGKAGGVLEGMLNRDDVPTALLAKSKCIVILPDIRKFSFGVGGTGGRGVMTCHTGKNFDGHWSAPAIYTVSGASVGLQVGGSASDYVLLVMTNKGVDALLKGKMKLGSSASVAAGPSGATTASTWSGGSDILSYRRTTRLFAGATLAGAVLDSDDSANRTLYSKPVTAREILVAGAVPSPPSAKPLVTLLNAKAH